MATFTSHIHCFFKRTIKTPIQENVIRIQQEIESQYNVTCFKIQFEKDDHSKFEFLCHFEVEIQAENKLIAMLLEGQMLQNFSHLDIYERCLFGENEINYLLPCD